MSKRRYEPSPPPVATAVDASEQPPAVAPSTHANEVCPHVSSSSRTSSTIEPLPEQALGRKRARVASAGFSWLSLLAPIEGQLMLRCLDICSRLRAARSNQQLLSAASQPFSWPQEQMVTLRVTNDVAELQALGARVRASLLRLSAIHLRMRLLNFRPPPLELFAVPNVHFLTLQPPIHFAAVADDFLLPMLRHPSARQLRSLDISRLWHQQLRSLDVSRLLCHRCSSAELQQLRTLPRLHSLSLGASACRELTTLQPLSLLPALTHLGLGGPTRQPCLLSSLSLCVRLVSLKLSHATVGMDLVHCLAQLPALQRLNLHYGDVEEQTAGAWGTLRSLREIQVEDVKKADQLICVLNELPALRLLRWRCRAPDSLAWDERRRLPLFHSRDPLLVAAPLLQVELLMPRAIDCWFVRPPRFVSYMTAELTNVRQRAWDYLRDLPSQLQPRVRIVEVDSEDDE